MNDFHAAEQIALQYVQHLNNEMNRRKWDWVRDPGDDDMRPYRRVPAKHPLLALSPDSAEERPYGWMFYYTTREYLETGDFNFALGGNGPLVVRRDSDKVWAYGFRPRPEEIDELHRLGPPLSPGGDEPPNRRGM